MRTLVFLFVVLIAALPARGQGAYQIAPGDRLNVTVLEDPNLNAQVLVRPDGRITLPIAGSIPVVGRTPEQVQSIVTSRLAGSFNVTPTVTVSLAAVAPPGLETPETIVPLNIYVLGQVTTPGLLQIQPDQTLTVLQALAQAGGLTPFARGEAIQIRRTDIATGEETIFPFNYQDLEEGRRLTSNILLEAGDVIFVPERGLFD